MNRAGRHPQNALTAVAVRAQKQPGRYADGNGLYLVVDPSGAKRWLLRTVVQGRRRDIGLGGLSWVSLAEARERAAALRKVAREGGDPLANKEAARPAETVTFRQAAERVHAAATPSWKNSKHAAQWIVTLRTYAFPLIGERPVGEVGSADLLKVLSPIWLTKPETARRVRQRLGAVLDWATQAGHRSGENPVKTITRGLPRQSDRAQHHKAVPYEDAPVFMAKLRVGSGDELARLAFEFLILTAVRTSEALGALWGEIDLDNKVWAIPATRMKAQQEHRVPLSGRAVMVLRRARELAPTSKLVFPGRQRTKPFSNMVFAMILRRMKVNATPHGFRSTFRDWASEVSSFPHEVAEMALAHTIKSKVEQAYRRGNLIEKRREMMEAWAAYLEPGSGS